MYSTIYNNIFFIRTLYGSMFGFFITELRKCVKCRNGAAVSSIQKKMWGELRNKDKPELVL